MELVVNLIVGIAWPVAVVWIAYVFKGELKSLLRRVSQLKYKDLEAQFGAGLALAESEVSSLQGTSKNRRFQPATVSSGLKSSGLPVL